MTVTKSRTRVPLVNQVLKNAALLFGAGVFAMGVGGCVQLAAPEKPIEINLNINIRQDVLVRLDKDVRDLVDKNPGVF